MSGYFLSGTTLTAAGLNVLVPAAGALLGGANIGGTITPQTITLGTGLSLSGTVLNSAGAGGTVTQVATTGAGISGGPITATGTLAVEWNAGTVAAIGNGLTIAANTMSISAGSGLGFTAGAIIAQWQGGTVTALGTGVSLVGGTLSATGSGGSVTQVSSGTGLTGGPISTTGTLSLATRTASTLMGNPTAGSATPTDIAIGTGVTLSALGTLTAGGSGGTVTGVSTTGAGVSVVAGGSIVTSGTLQVEWNAGTVAAVGDGLIIATGSSLSALIGVGLSISAGTIVANWQETVVTALAGGLSISGTTLEDQWNAGTVTALAGGLSITSGTLSAAGASGEWTAGTVTAISSLMTIASGTLSLENVANLSVLGRTGGGTGALSAIAFNTMMYDGLVSPGFGSLFSVPNGGGIANVSIGTRGQLLTAQPSGGVEFPTWEGSWGNTGANTPTLGTNSPSTNLTPVGYLALPDSAGTVRYIPYF
jgi:trimeric autotransporter adhesin